MDGGVFAYVGRAADGGYNPFVYRSSLRYDDIEIAEDVYLIVRERAEEYVYKKSKPDPQQNPVAVGGAPPAPNSAGSGGDATIRQPVATSGTSTTTSADGNIPVSEPPPGAKIAGFTWTGEVPSQIWMNFYTKVLSRFATTGGLKLTLSVDVTPPGGTVMNKVEETKVALRELGMIETVEIKTEGSD